MTTSSGRSYSGRALADGAGRAPALVLDDPLSYWGGVDPATGTVIDAHHPQVGAVLAGRVVVMPGGRGSSSSSSVVAESIRARTAPCATLLLGADGIIALGALVAAELYGRRHPVVVLERDAYAAIATGDVVDVSAHDGHATVRVETPSAFRGSPGRRGGDR